MMLLCTVTVTFAVANKINVIIPGTVKWSSSFSIAVKLAFTFAITVSIFCYFYSYCKKLVSLMLLLLN